MSGTFGDGRRAAAHKIDLARPVQDYLPGLLPGSYPPIAVGSLLDHTSGLPSSHEDDGAQDPAWVVRHRFDVWTPGQVVASAAEQPMVFQPGTRQQYNGVNYFIAIRGPHAHGYVVVNGVSTDITGQSAYGWAESGIISTSGDLSRFVVALLRGRLLPRAEMARMFTVPNVEFTGSGCPGGKACFSMGLERTAFPNGVTVWGKSGGMPGYSTAAFATRDLRRVLVYSLTPTGNRDGSEGAYVRRIAAAAFDPGMGG